MDDDCRCDEYEHSIKGYNYLFFIFIKNYYLIGFMVYDKTCE